MPLPHLHESGLQKTIRFPFRKSDKRAKTFRRLFLLELKSHMTLRVRKFSDNLFEGKQILFS